MLDDEKQGSGADSNQQSSEPSGSTQGSNLPPVDNQVLERGAPSGDLEKRAGN